MSRDPSQPDSTPPPSSAPRAPEAASGAPTLFERDRLFTHTSPGSGAFRFDAAVARVFPDMLRRSIPGYTTLLELIGVLAAQIVQHETRVYDLGSSLGAVSLSIRHALGSRSAKIIAVDNSEAMVERSRELIDMDTAQVPVEVHHGDIADFPIENASLVVLNFTLQFLPVEVRAALLEKIHTALVPGGCLVLSEKVLTGRAPDDLWNQKLHDAFRESNGYSQLELSRKRQALERVLVPDSIDEHEARLVQAGFSPQPWFRALHFVSWVATRKVDAR